VCAASGRGVDRNPAYWEDYSPLQQVKHDLIRCYLGVLSSIIEHGIACRVHDHP